MNYKTRIMFILFIFIITNCASNYNTINNHDNCLIVEAIKDDKLITSFKPKAFLNNNPKAFFGMYSYWKEADSKTKNLGISLTGKVEWIFSESDIKYMRKKYNQWMEINWKNMYCEKSGIEFSNKSNTTITYPFYNRNKTKAMVSLSITGSGTKMILLKKHKNTWAIVGELTHNFAH